MKHPVGILEIAKMYEDFQADSVLIKEGLLYSYSPGYIFSHLKHSLRFNQSQVSLITGTGNSKYFEIKIYKKDIINLNKLITFMNNSCGWFPSYILSETSDEKFSDKFLNDKREELENGMLSEFIIRFEAKFDTVIEKRKLPEYIYHATLKSKIEKIKKIGLKPTSESKQSNHPDRIYFTLSSEDAKRLIPRFVEKRKGETKLEDYCILKIDVSLLYPGIVFFEDPMFMFFDKIGVYTMSNINPGAISLVE